MRGQSRLRIKLSRFIAHEAFVAEKVGAEVVVATALLSVVLFFSIIYGAPYAHRVRPSPLLLSLFFAGFAYAGMAAAGAMSLANDLKGPALLLLSQPLSRTAYAVSWLVAAAAMPLASLSLVAVLATSVVDPQLLSLLTVEAVALWALDRIIVALLTFSASLVTKRPGSALVTWLLLDIGLTFAAPFFFAHLVEDPGILIALLTLKPFMHAMAELPLPLWGFPHSSLALAASLAATYIVLARRVEV